MNLSRQSHLQAIMNNDEQSHPKIFTCTYVENDFYRSIAFENGNESEKSTAFKERHMTIWITRFWIFYCLQEDKSESCAASCTGTVILHAFNRRSFEAALVSSFASAAAAFSNIKNWKIYNFALKRSAKQLVSFLTADFLNICGLRENFQDHRACACFET